MTGKELHAMSRSELDDFSTNIAGLPPPPHDAPIEDSYRWAVATIMLLCCKGAANIEHAKNLAASLLIRGRADSALKLQPYIEKALGRSITDAEMAAGRVDGFTPPADLANLWHPGLKDLL